MKLSKVISLGLAIAVLLAVAVPPGFTSGGGRQFSVPPKTYNNIDFETSNIQQNGKIVGYPFNHAVSTFTLDIEGKRGNIFYRNTAAPNFKVDTPYSLLVDGYAVIFTDYYRLPTTTNSAHVQIQFNGHRNESTNYYIGYMDNDTFISIASVPPGDEPIVNFNYTRPFLVASYTHYTSTQSSYTFYGAYRIVINYSENVETGPTLPPVVEPPTTSPPTPPTIPSVDDGYATEQTLSAFAEYQNKIQYFIAWELAVIWGDLKTWLNTSNDYLESINNKLDNLPTGGSTDLSTLETLLNDLIDTQATEQERQMSEGAESLRDGYNAIFTENENPIDSKDFMGLGIIAHFFDSFGSGSQLNPVTQAFSGDWWNIWDNLDNSFEEASNYVYDPSG